MRVQSGDWSSLDAHAHAAGLRSRGKERGFLGAGEEWLQQNARGKAGARWVLCSRWGGWERTCASLLIVHTAPKAEVTERCKVPLWRVAGLLGSKTGAERSCSHSQFLCILISVNTRTPDLG